MLRRLCRRVKMKSLALTFVILLPVACSSPGEQGAMKVLVQEYLLWIRAETGLVVPPPPTIVFVSAEKMRERAGGSYSAMAIYANDTVTIYLPANWNRREMYHRAMLLHELVHHVQIFNQVPVRCAAEREWQAYSLTLNWLSRQGVEDPYAVLNLDELTVAILSACFPQTE